MKTRVLHCITNLASDGAQRMLLRLVKSIDRSRFDCSVVSLSTEGTLFDHFREAGVKVQCAGMRKGTPSPTGLWKLASIIRETRPHVLQGWMYHANLCLYLSRILLAEKPPLLWNIRRCLYDPKGDKRSTRLVVKAGALLSPRADVIVYCAALSAKQHEAFGYRARATYSIGNGFEADAFRPSLEAPERIRKELNISNDAPIVGIVGRYHPHKAQDNFVRAAGYVRQTLPNVQYVMVGSGLDTSNRSISSLIQELGLGSVVHLLGHRADVQQIVPGFDVYCSSSFSEGFPNAVGEAMASGVPCVVTDAGASRDLVGDTGEVVPREDPEALAGALVRLLRAPSEERKSQGLRARERIIETFSIGSVAKQYEQLYEAYGAGSHV